MGQSHYFKCSIPSTMEGWDIYEINVNFEPNDPTRYQPCVELNIEETIDVWVFFRGEFAPRGIINQLYGKKIWVSTEPIERQDVNNLFFGNGKDFVREHRKLFDYMTHYDETEVDKINQTLQVNQAFPLPTNLLTHDVEYKQKLYDGVFLGRVNERRSVLLGAIKKDYDFLHVDHGLIGPESIRAHNQARIGISLQVGDFKQFPHRVMNMMACGLPIICDELTHTNFLKEGEEKYFCFMKDNSPIKMYEAFKKLLEDEDWRITCGKKMREIVEREFDASKKWKELLEVIV